MTCFNPRKAWIGRPSTGPGNGGLVFNPRLALNPDRPLQTPCRRCNGCRQKARKEWVGRLIHESRMHDASCSVTLTYADEHFPEPRLDHPKWPGVAVVDVPRDWQLFMKRLREHFGRPGLKCFAMPELGEKTNRLHFHALIYGVDFREDRRRFGSFSDGSFRWVSPTLTNLWGNGDEGFQQVGQVTPAAAMYVAGYVLKKAMGPEARALVPAVHPVSGESVLMTPLRPLMSRRPGIGASYFDKFGDGCFPSDFYIQDGKRNAVPGYYLNRLKKRDEAGEKLAESVKRARKRKAITPQAKANATPARLKVREEVLMHRLKGRRTTL